MEIINVAVRDRRAALRPTELAEFLFLFRATNVALSRIVPKSLHRKCRLPLKKEITGYRSRLAGYSPKQLDSLFDPTRSPDLLRIEHITRESPMEMAFVGYGFLIVLAVIFSGGRIRLDPRGIEAELPPFGKGLKHLREALGLNDRLNTSYGVRETTIRLNKREYEELMTPVRGSGGFQSFFEALQRRVNKQTRKLTLTKQDLERIYRHKADPGKGGWQSRFEKVFGRHFPNERNC